MQSNSFVSNIRIRINDALFNHIGVTKKNLEPINASQLSSSLPKVGDINQRMIGNCYFLASVGSIITRDPNFINELLKVNDRGEIEVTFHKIKDAYQTVTYILDPTKVVNKKFGLPFKMNAHKHDAIYLLEKAYAIHRMITEQTNYLDEDIPSVEELRKNDLDINRIIKSPGTALKIASLESTDKFEFIKMLSHKNPKDSLVRVKINGKKQNIKANEVSIQIKNEFVSLDKLEFIKNKIIKNYPNYLAALTSGTSINAFSALVGKPAKHNDSDYMRLKEINVDIKYLMSTFIENLASANQLANDFEISEQDKIKKVFQYLNQDKCAKDKELLTKIFGDINSKEAIYFIRKIDFNLYYPASIFLDNFKSYNRKHFNKKDIHTELEKFFNPLFSTTDAHDTEQKAQQKLNRFINTEIPYKRGTGKYTSAQEKIFDFVKDKLKSGNLITLDTKANVGSSQRKTVFSSANEPISKGLVGNHTYQVINAYERNGIKFVLVRNPWGNYGRDYEFKNKMIQNKSVPVLSSKSQLQFGFTSFFRTIKNKIAKVIFRKLRRKGPISNPALPVDPMIEQHINRKGGFFEFELSDFINRCDGITSSRLIPYALKKQLTTLLKLAAELNASPSRSDVMLTVLHNQMSLLKTSLDKQKSNAIDVHSAMAVAYDLAGETEKANLQLKKLGSDWKLEDALTHLKSEFREDFPELGNIILSSQAGPKTEDKKEVDEEEISLIRNSRLAS